MIDPYRRSDMMQKYEGANSTQALLTLPGDIAYQEASIAEMEHLVSQKEVKRDKEEALAFIHADGTNKEREVKAELVALDRQPAVDEAKLNVKLARATYTYLVNQFLTHRKLSSTEMTSQAPSRTA